MLGAVGLPELGWLCCEIYRGWRLSPQKHSNCRTAIEDTSENGDAGPTEKMGEELDYFLEEQKKKLAQDIAELEKDPPYMEIRSSGHETSRADNEWISVAKENIPPNGQFNEDTANMKQIEETSYGLSLPLGEEYERKKHKLKEELRQDYRKYLNQGNAQVKRKKHLRSTGEIDPSTQGMSLPIGERLSGKERLRLERNQEYNQFLRMKEDDHERFRVAAVAKHNQNEKTVIKGRLQPQPEPPVQMPYKDYEVSKKNSYTSMEAYEELLNKRRSVEDRQHRREVETEPQERTSRKAEEAHAYRKYRASDRDRDVLDRPRQVHAELDVERRPQRLYLAPDVREDGQSRPRYETDLRERRPLRHTEPNERIPQHYYADSHVYQPDQASYYQIQTQENRPYRERRDRELPIDYEDDFREQSHRRPISAVTKSRPKIENPIQNTERSKSAHVKDEHFASTLLIGGGDQDAQQKRKERYRQDLMEQMAEQQRNKRREKELELKVAASGAIDPEKQPDRLRQFGAVNRHQDVPDRNVPYRPGAYESEKTGRRDQKPAFEDKAPPGRPRVAFQTPVPEVVVPASNFPANEEFHRGLSSALGEIVAPRIAAVPPPQPPVLADNYRTPYDDAYYYYGVRNPLDPNLAYYSQGMLGLQPTLESSIPATHLIKNQQEDQNFVNRQPVTERRGASLGLFPEEKPKQSKAAAISYQEELEKQILERNEKRRKEKQEQERYDAKLDEEIRNYNPWGKGGGGAPLKDAKGNLISDLKMMHKHNEDAYQNPDAKPLEDRRAVVAVNLNPADTGSSTSKIPGFSFANNSPYARGTIFSEPQTEQQIHQQESYKNFLRLQIDEKRRKEEEEREKIRLEEEREEKRLAEQRDKIQREYEEEQNKKKLKEEEQRIKNEELVRLAEERRKEAERKRKEEEEKHDKQLRQYYDQEKQATVSEEELKPSRPPSPVIPALQHKRSSRVKRPPTAESRVFVQSIDEPQSRAVSPPVPARRNQLRAYDEKTSVISELSELRKQLRSEQKRLEGRLHDADRDDTSSASISGRRREKNSADAFDLARQKLQATVRRPSSKAQDAVNMHNIREFNDLKYRDTDTREGVRHMYPDPPNDNQTLDIQQQALLREQQRNLNRMKKRTVMPDEFERAPVYSLRHVGMLRDQPSDLMKTSLLESESAFIGENGEPYIPFRDTTPDLHRLPSARDRRRHKNIAPDYDNDIPPVPPIPLHQLDGFSLRSGSSINVDELQMRNEERLRRLSKLRRSSMSTDGDPDALGDAEDILKLFPTKAGDRPQSVDTVATDPWLRPGTSETLKRFMSGQLNHDKLNNDNALNFNWQGLSTAHG
ncbi:centrosome and spindle pole-associated protein 1 [Bombina bombina]|uniref:centrosome and spindle pole-associated protein 1 n=1 Tax=Bombina bombina TaxID=8345 RepID=UPI00235A502B|nr:centrosome and spindle pole-associated protein 1 [Bombina bombina]